MNKTNRIGDAVRRIGEYVDYNAWQIIIAANTLGVASSTYSIACSNAMIQNRPIGALETLAIGGCVLAGIANLALMRSPRRNREYNSSNRGGR